MPRVSKAQAAVNHDAIEAAASRLFRERGLGDVTVAEVMAEAGLTHGGFYAHYPSKDALAASACEHAFALAAENWRRRIQSAPTPLEASRTIAERYLGAVNRDPSVASCPTATLVADVARAGRTHPIHAAYVAGVRNQIDTLASLGTSGDAAADRSEACARLATMIGALLLARACHGDPIADEIATAARQRLTGDARGATTPKRRPRRAKRQGGTR